MSYRCRECEIARVVNQGEYCSTCSGADRQAELAALRSEVERLREALIQIEDMATMGLVPSFEQFRRVASVALAAPQGKT